MPLICEFFGIKIYMYWDEHMPPHFHAEYSGLKALVSIKEVIILRGSLPSRQLKLVLAWCELHQKELLENWSSAMKHGKIHWIEPIN